MKKIGLFILFFVFIFTTIGLSREITIFHAGSLSVPFKYLTKAYTKIDKDVKFALESSGSVAAIRKITELGKPADILASADASIIGKMMFPKYATWYKEFATNQMVIAYREDTPYSKKINKDNWFEILLKKDIEYGHSDPNMDPCGYRTLLLWKLAEIYYKKPGLFDALNRGCPKRNIRPKAVSLIALLESKNLDYIFEYKSVAIQHHLKYLELPPDINLGDIKYKEFYKKAQVEIVGNKPGTKIKIKGAPIVYGLTIPTVAKNKKGAEKFLMFM